MVANVPPRRPPASLLIVTANDVAVSARPQLMQAQVKLVIDPKTLSVPGNVGLNDAIVVRVSGGPLPRA
jgi:hypothetical protein